MRWYLNDASLQAQFTDLTKLESRLRDLLVARSRVPSIKQNLRSTRSLPGAMAAPGISVREFLQRCRDKDLRTAIFTWLDRTGPFVEDDRMEELDDYFECMDFDVTATGLGEAARRTRAGEDCATYSFEGGESNFAIDPLEVDHGLSEERLGRHAVRNHWSADGLVEHALAAGPAITSWQALVEGARARFRHLEIAELHQNAMLAREPFEASVRDRALALMAMLDTYVAGRTENGAEGPASREIIDAHFKGERALFTGESSTNERNFRQELTFASLEKRDLFAPWHGKISHRFFRMHFEWPLAPERQKLAILYLGPKITKS
ncbi:Hypothetical protein NGAL_HAMBI2610_41950 [Neorhizobium galegae bv. orientalis]|nr:Hypothetical protein NGAL_HAMBI2610_41950 [Neorhizobium galegae bv. orientalis]